MPDIFEWTINDWINKIGDIFRYLLRRWYLLVLGGLIGVAIGYYRNKDIKTTYTATMSFVLSESKSSGGGFAGIAAQLGLDVGGNNPDNVFSGDNIIELFKSTKLIKQGLLSMPDSATQQSLLNYIAVNQYPHYKSILPFPSDPKKFSAEQTSLFRQIIQLVGRSFIIFKKDKKLVFYYISATSENEKAAYYIAKCMLDQTSRFFIETKTSTAKKGLKLLQKEADSLATVLRGTFHSTASMADRTYNINPSLTAQRSGAQLNQAKVIAIGAAYTEVMRGLEVAKINVLKETPLFSVIDEPDLPLAPETINVMKRSIMMGILGFIVAVIVLSVINIYYTLIKPYIYSNMKPR